MIRTILLVLMVLLCWQAPSFAAVVHAEDGLKVGNSNNLTFYDKDDWWDSFEIGTLAAGETTSLIMQNVPTVRMGANIRCYQQNPQSYNEGDDLLILYSKVTYADGDPATADGEITIRVKNIGAQRSFGLDQFVCTHDISVNPEQ